MFGFKRSRLGPHALRTGPASGDLAPGLGEGDEAEHWFSWGNSALNYDYGMHFWDATEIFAQKIKRISILVVVNFGINGDILK